MDYISETDTYEIRLASLVSNVDKDVIVELYQPLIGSTATILFLTLLKQKRNEDDDIIFSHASLLSLMQIAPGNLLTARHALEAVGLLRSYEKDDGETRSYIYMLYAPKTPKEFFDDVLFKGLLIQYLGEKEAKRLAFHYHIDVKIPAGFSEISASFVDVFNPDYDDASFRKTIDDSIAGHEVGRVKIEFNYDLFFKYIEDNSQILKSVFTKKDMNEISRLATLFGLDEKTMASIIIDEYDANATPHINFANVSDKAKEHIKYPFLKKGNVKSKVSGDSLISKKIRLMEKTSPADWLSLLQNNTKPANSDLNIVNSLSENYGFSTGVINAIIDYVLTKNNNVLTNNYCEKIASSFAREGVQTAIDAMNYLNKITLGKRNRINNAKPTESEQTNTASEKTAKSTQEQVSDEEINNIISSIEQHKKGGRKR